MNSREWSAGEDSKEMKFEAEQLSKCREKKRVNGLRAGVRGTEKPVQDIISTILKCKKWIWVINEKQKIAIFGNASSSNREKSEKY